MKTAFRIYTDPGHGWIAVKRAMLRDMGILHKVTRYSYQRGQTVYLEEDCDASMFHEAFIAKYGKQPTYEERFFDNDCFVRKCDNFELDADDR